MTQGKRLGEMLWGVIVVLAILTVGPMETGMADPAPMPAALCFVVSGAGTTEANGLYTYASGEINEGIETRAYVNSVTGAVISGYAFVVDDQWNWTLTLGGEFNILYYNGILAPDLALTGWEVADGQATAPTLRLCTTAAGPTIIPTGEVFGSFLNRASALAGGDVPLMIGLQPLAAIYEAGETLTGSCQILGSSGLPTGASFVHVYIYSVDVSANPESILLVNHWMATYNRSTREFEIAWDTMDAAPGYYDLRLVFDGGSTITYRIQLIPAGS
jgi:hypothetical protein